MQICSTSIHKKNDSHIDSKTLFHGHEIGQTKFQEWVALLVVEKQVGEDAGWHHPGGDLGTLTKPQSDS